MTVVALEEARARHRRELRAGLEEAGRAAQELHRAALALLVTPLDDERIAELAGRARAALGTISAVRDRLARVSP